LLVLEDIEDDCVLLADPDILVVELEEASLLGEAELV
jgi:hypothetical protein